MIKKSLIKFKSLTRWLIIIFLMVLVFDIKIGDENGGDMEIISGEKEDEKVKKVDKLEEIAARQNQIKEFRAENEDVEAWIYIPNTTVDWPVMRWKADGRENKSFYERRDEKKNYAFDGSIFGADGVKFGNREEISNNMILHGHNLDDNPNGKRFAQLMKFLNIEFAKKTPYIYISTQEDNLIYEIYAVFFTDLEFECYWIGLGEREQEEMINGAKERSEYIYDVKTTGNDKIVTLSTCTYKYGVYRSIGQENTRFVIQGRLIDNDQKLKQTAKLIKNPSPKQPQIPKK